MEKFTEIGKAGAVERLFEGTGYKAFEDCRFETAGKGYITQSGKMFLEGIDFDLTYFPLKHLGYKCAVAVTGELYSRMSRPRTLSVTLGISAKLDFGHIKELWSGVTAAAKEHGYAKVALDMVPSQNGLCIAVSATGETSLLTGKRRPEARSMDLICVSDNLGAAFSASRYWKGRSANSTRPKMIPDSRPSKNTSILWGHI